METTVNGVNIGAASDLSSGRSRFACASTRCKPLLESQGAPAELAAGDKTSDGVEWCRSSADGPVADSAGAVVDALPTPEDEAVSAPDPRAELALEPGLPAARTAAGSEAGPARTDTILAADSDA
jgi:hypothetical protein